ncbi:MAG: peptidoglycan glycosyltransferase [Lachnospiraceae bacterium]|nr:peptidoglycan glycosyltransferase [Lachnospiraceae bacterium]
MDGLNSMQKKRLVLYVLMFLIVIIYVTVHLIYIMIFDAERYAKEIKDLHEREREIKAPRGEIVDRNGEVIATNKTVCTISVIHSQILDEEQVIEVLSKELNLDKDAVSKKVKKVSVREKIQSNVEKEVGDRIRDYHLAGVKVDEDYKRYYPYDSLASKVLGFTGADNQGIVGLETQYDAYLTGTTGKILTKTDAKGLELDGMAELREEGIAGNTLHTSLDLNIQKYAEQAAYKALKEKEANHVSIIVMNPNNGEIYAMVNAPEYNLNEPFSLNYETDLQKETDEYQNALNGMWRNPCINDTYEPGSTFKMVTATAALEEKVVNVNSTFNCPGFKIVEDRRIRCHKTTGHGAETFVTATQNSCNPAFIEIGMRVGVEKFYFYLNRLGLMEKSGVDLPGEAGTIIHKMENVGQVELATMSFGQSFQITPLQLLRAASAIINGGTLITPHFGVSASDENGEIVKTFEYPVVEDAVSKETSETMKMVLESVVAEGGGKYGQVEGYRVGGKTATSQKLPRSAHKYIGSFIGFAPADHPQVIAMCIIDEPTGVYYGGTIAAPVISGLYENILPYLIE